MAGAGYKLFNTGDVLTAAQVNTYLQEQTVMVFASAAARTTALTGVVAEGMISYLTDTDVVQYYNGTTWTTINTDQTPLTTKGDLFTFSTQDARLAVGSNGETLVADSSASTGLRWQGNFAAGKNKIINGDFGIWQRGTTFTNPAINSYTADRWYVAKDGSGSTVTVSQQSFTAGTAPVAGYEGTFFFRYNQSVAGTGANYNIIAQKIEDVRQFAGQTVTVSFWAKAAASLTLSEVQVSQSFGSGGSSDVNTTAISSLALTTSWVRYSYTVSVPSISGKTIGAGSALALKFFLPNNAIQTLDLWGVQVEAGNTATAFQTATGTLAGELAACQRYYYRANATGGYSRFGLGQATGATAATVVIPFPVVMRTKPTALEQSGTASHYAAVNAGASSTLAGTSVPTFDSANTQTASVTFTVSTGLVAGNASQCTDNNTSSAYLAWSAEL